MSKQENVNFNKTRDNFMPTDYQNFTSDIPHIDKVIEQC